MHLIIKMLWYVHLLTRTDSDVKAHWAICDITLSLHHLKCNCLWISVCVRVFLRACSQVLYLGCSKAQKWIKRKQNTFFLSPQRSVSQQLSIKVTLLFTGTHLCPVKTIWSPCQFFFPHLLKLMSYFPGYCKKNKIPITCGGKKSHLHQFRVSIHSDNLAFEVLLS